MESIPDRTALRRPGAAVIAAVLASVFFGLTETIADPDLWGHVRFGSDMLQSGNFQLRDQYSYTSGSQEWINHEWLSELIFAFTYQAAGEFGLLALKLIVGSILFIVLYLHLLKAGLSAIRAGLMLLIAYYPLSVGVLTVRPQLFTYLGFLLVVLAMEAADRGRWRWLLGLPVLFAIWVNLHGGFLIGILVLAVWGAFVLFERLRGVDRSVPGWAVVGCLLVSLLATLVNPYGVQLWEFLLRTVTIPRPEITEWGPIRLLTLDGAAYLLVSAVTAIALVRKAPPPSPRLWIVYALMAPLPILAVRHLPLFIIAALVISARPLARMWKTATTRSTGPLRPAWLSGGIWAVAGVMILLSVGRLQGVVIDADHQPFPARAVFTLKASGAGGNLAVFFDWGEYAIWHLAPDFRVSWDGRRETVYSPEVHSQNLNFFLGRGDWEELLREHETDLVLTPVGLPVHNLLEERSSWRLVYEDWFAAIFAREGSSQATRILSTDAPDLPPDGDGLHFP